MEISNNDGLMDVQNVLKSCKVKDSVVFLPDIQLERKLYLKIKTHLDLIGGKWNRKAQGFVFKADPTELLGDISDGKRRNIKKEFQFFPTPDHIADKLVALSDIKPHHLVLEPSAGQGALVNAIYRKTNLAQRVDCYELMDINRSILGKNPRVNIVGYNYLESKSNKTYDRIIANPPFSRNQDIDHIQKMYGDLKVGGKIVSLASKHWQLCGNKKEIGFRDWLEYTCSAVSEINAGEFKSSGTGIAMCCIVINK